MIFSNIRKHIDLFRRFGIAGNLLLLKENTKKGLLEVDLKECQHSIYLRPGTSDIPTFYKLFYYKEYNIPVKFEPEVILDLGANIGLATIYFANKYPKAKIFSVEPESGNFEMLVKNTEKYPNVTCINSGIWNRVTNLEITTGFGNWGFRVNEVDHENDNTVRAISIEKIMEMHMLNHIDILKIDIEGSEKELFEKNSEKWLPKTKLVVIELHDFFKKDCSKSMFKALNNFDYELSAIGENFICEIK